MTPKAKPYSLGRTIAIGLATAIAFAALSLFFLFMQAKDNQHRLAGEVVAVSGETASVQNAHGDVTVLIISADGRLRGMSSFQDLDIGQHVMMRGSFLEDSTFEVDRMRILTDRPLE
ncbi:MAG: hypothetical protein AAFR73_06070 [Pseudomonadota bacterium]